MQGNWYNPEKQRILEMVDLADLIGEQLPLKRAGREYKAICPFHDDSHPSMYVNPQKGIYKCFACGAGGNALTWLEKYFHMTRGEAWKLLSERTGIEIHYENRSASRGGTRGGEYGGGDLPGGEESAGEFVDLDPAEIIRAHEVALSFYRTILKHPVHGAVAREIFAGRGINDEMIERFQLGASPGGDMWDGLVRTLNKRGIDIEAFIASGLVSRRRSGDGYIDRFRNRLIFPIHDLLGRPIAFGARQIDTDDDPKYLNSPEHARFSKSGTLYGLHLAQRSIQEKSLAIVVEGYTDVIACHQAGVDNAVATLGTALTRQHATILQRFCDKVVLLFDGDKAGQKAADRAVEIFFQTNVDIKMGMLPEGCDPADILSNGSGRAIFDCVIDDAEDALDYLLRSFGDQMRETAGSVSGTQRVIESFLRRLGLLGFHRMSSIRRDLVIPRLADMLSMDKAKILKAIPRARGRRFEGSDDVGEGSVSEEYGAVVSSGRIDAERGILGCLLVLPGLYFEKCDEVGEGVRARVERIRWSVSSHGELMKRYMIFLEHEDVAAQGGGRIPEFGEPSLDALAADLCYEITKQAEDRGPEYIAFLLHAFLKSIEEYEEVRKITDERDAGDDNQLLIITKLRQLQTTGGRRRVPFLDVQSSGQVSDLDVRDTEGAAKVSAVRSATTVEESFSEPDVVPGEEPIEAEHDDA